MAEIQETVNALIAAMRTIGAGRLQSINADEKFTEARGAITAAMGSVTPEPLSTAMEMLVGAHDMAQQAVKQATDAIVQIEHYVGAIQG